MVDLVLDPFVSLFFVKVNSIVFSFSTIFSSFNFQMFPISVLLLLILTTVAKGDIYTDYVNHATAVANCQVHCRDEFTHCIQRDPYTYSHKVHCGVVYGQCLEHCNQDPLITFTEAPFPAVGGDVLTTDRHLSHITPTTLKPIPSTKSTPTQDIWVTLKKKRAGIFKI